MDFEKFYELEHKVNEQELNSIYHSLYDRGFDIRRTGSEDDFGNKLLFWRYKSDLHDYILELSSDDEQFNRLLHKAMDLKELSIIFWICYYSFMQSFGRFQSGYVKFDPDTSLRTATDGDLNLHHCIEKGNKRFIQYEIDDIDNLKNKVKKMINYYDRGHTDEWFKIDSGQMNGQYLFSFDWFLYNYCYYLPARILYTGNITFIEHANNIKSSKPYRMFILDLVLSVYNGEYLRSHEVIMLCYHLSLPSEMQIFAQHFLMATEKFAENNSKSFGDFFDEKISEYKSFLNTYNSDVNKDFDNKFKEFATSMLCIDSYSSAELAINMLNIRRIYSPQTALE